MTNYYKKLRQQLPHRYTKAISNRVEGITPRQVKAVFSGEIVNMETVEPIVEAAIQISKESQNRNRHLLRKLKSATRIKTSKKAA